MTKKIEEARNKFEEDDEDEYMKHSDKDVKNDNGKDDEENTEDDEENTEDDNHLKEKFFQFLLLLFLRGSSFS